MGCLELNIGAAEHQTVMPRSVKWRLHKLHDPMGGTASHVANEHYLREGLVLTAVVISSCESFSMDQSGLGQDGPIHPWQSFT